MRLQNHIIIGFVIPLILGIIVCIGFTIIPFFVDYPSWTIKTKEFVKVSTKNTTELRTFSQATYISTFFKQVENDIQVMHDYAKGILTKQILYNSTYKSYYSVEAIDPETPQLDGENVYMASTNFKLGIGTKKDFYEFSFVNDTSLVDNVFRAVYKSSNIYGKMYMGTNNGLFRRFPYARLEHYSSLAYVCESNFQPVVGYDPRCRSWYVQSVSTDNIMFTPPYKDAFTGNMHISISKRIHHNNILLGVIAGDFSMELLDKLVLDNKILSNGYSMLIDSNGLVISYPKLDRKIIDPKIWNIETKLTKVQWDNILKYESFDVKTDIIGNFYVTYTNIPKNTYKLIMIYPEQDLYESSANLENIIKLISGLGAGIMVLVTFIVTIVILFVVIRVSRYYTRPIMEFTTVLEKMTNVVADVELNNISPVSKELSIVSKSISNLLVAVKFGNSAYFNGDLDKALQNYKLAEKMMIETNNQKGLGVCYNNIGNAYKQMKQDNLALEYYNKSCENIEQIIKTQHDTGSNNNIILANRLMNIGVLYSDASNYTLAENYFARSLELHKKADNIFGIAKVYSNLGQIYIKNGNTSYAEKMFHEAYMLYETKKNDYLCQYINYDIGYLKYNQGQLAEAAKWFEFTVNNFKNMDSYVKKNCLLFLKEIYQMTGDTQKLEYVCSALPESKKKHLYFLLDVSGSMAGSPIQTCKKSIVDIINKYTKQYDDISLSVFSGTTNEIFKNKKRDNYIEMCTAVEKINTSGGTAFYDALRHVLNSGVKKSWIIALTDGDDNQSKNSDITDIIKNIQKTENIIIIIGVGSLQNKKKLIDLCNAHSKGKYIETTHEAINVAFEQAASIIVGQSNVEQL